MKKALRAKIDIKATIEIESNLTVEDGSFYLSAIETDEVTLAAKHSEHLLSQYKQLNKPLINGDFWEDNLNYEYEHIEEQNMVILNITGDFAFELSNYDELDGYDIDDGTVNSIFVTWATDGDSDKIVAKVVSLSGGLADCVEDEEFEEL